LATPSLSLAALLAAVVMLAALLSAVAVRLLALPSAAASLFAAHLAGSAHVIVILNHIGATFRNRFASNRVHKKLLSPRVGPHWRNDVMETVSVQCQSMAKHASLL
jgi:hypothetical protein